MRKSKFNYRIIQDFSSSFKRAQDEATKELVGQVKYKIFLNVLNLLSAHLDRLNNIQFKNLQNR